MRERASEGEINPNVRRFVTPPKFSLHFPSTCFRFDFRTTASTLLLRRMATVSCANLESFIGCFICLISKCEIRYEGVLYFFNIQDSIIGLKDGTFARRLRKCATEPPYLSFCDFLLMVPRCLVWLIWMI